MIVARFRRALALRPVQRIKHVVDFNGTLTKNTGLVTNVVLAKDDPTLAVPTSVQTGSKVFAIYCDVQVACKTTVASAIPNIYLQIVKNNGGNLTLPNITSVGVSDDKRYTFHQEMILVENATAGNSKALLKAVIKVPKVYQRMGPNDSIQLQIFAPSIDITFCMQFHYKEFR